MRIDRLELALVKLPLVHFFETSFGRISEKEFLLIRVDAGRSTGWGECVADRDPYYSAETNTTAWHVIGDHIAPRVVGVEFAHPRDIFPALRAIRGHNMAKAAVEMAAWDLYAKSRDEPLSRVLGGTRARIASGVSIGIQDSLEDLAAKVERELAAGYQRVKIKIKPGWDVAAVETIRDRFGAIPLMVDANAAYTLDDAEHLGTLDRFKLMMIEQPLDEDDIADHARLQKQIATPICLDESIKSVAAADEAIAMGACKIINIKPGRVGGFRESIRLHDLCVARGVPVWHGGMLESGIGRAANIHLSSLEGFSLPGDVAGSRRYFNPDLIDPPIDVDANGTIAVPDAPGIGVAIVEERVRRATVRRDVIQAAFRSERRSLVRFHPMRSWCALGAVVAALAAARCASAPVVVVAPAGPTFEQKMASILRLEDHRILRDVAPPVPPAPPVSDRSKGAPAVAPPLPPPDLIRMLADSEARVRRRAALAIGRAGLVEGAQPLAALLADADPEVRQMAAFALGLIGAEAKSQRDALVKALGDESPLVQGSAAEALGLIGDEIAAAAVGAMVAKNIQAGALANTQGDDDGRRDTPDAAARLGIYALVRLKAYAPLASAIFDANGQLRVHPWPVAFALQRLEDKRAAPALAVLARDANPYTRAFAITGLGRLKDRAALPTLLPMLASGAGGNLAVLIETIRAVGRIGDSSAAPALLALAQKPDVEPHVKLEAVTALAGFHDPSVPGLMDSLLDFVSDPQPGIRAAALRADAALDPEGFLTVLSGLDPDPNWSVRSAVASMVATLPTEAAVPRLNTMLGDGDQRVIPAVLNALTRLHPPDTERVLLERLKADDPVVRVAAANGIGQLKPAGGAAALAEAYRFGERDGTYIARGAALAALAKYGAADAVPVLKAALADKDWAVRVRAAQLLKALDPATDADAAIRPAPTQVSADLYSAPRLVDPQVSTQVYIDTDRGTIQVELAVLDAPLTVENFVALARKGYFDGITIHRVVPDFVVQDGDPRGDGEGGPGYTIRDELNERPYLRGTVGMALDWNDTGGSQFFITHSPQPHLDAKYTVFGRVIAGMDVVDKIQQGDVIRKVRVWDGASAPTAPKN